MTVEDALAFIEEHGIILEAGRGPVPNLAEHIAGDPIMGSWWVHPKASEIFTLTRSARDSPDVLTCRLVQRKVTFVHRRLWPSSDCRPFFPSRIWLLSGKSTPAQARIG